MTDWLVIVAIWLVLALLSALFVAVIDRVFSRFA